MDRSGWVDMLEMNVYIPILCTDMQHIRTSHVNTYHWHIHSIQVNITANKPIMFSSDHIEQSMYFLSFLWLFRRTALFLFYDIN
jgi:hypothetical protein